MLKKGSRKAWEKVFQEMKNTLESINRKIFQGGIGPDMLTEELYRHLSETDWQVLDLFDKRKESEVTLTEWLIPEAWKLFICNRKEILSLSRTDEDSLTEEESEDEFRIRIAIEVKSTLDRMPNQRQSEILRLFFIEGYNATETAEMYGVSEEEAEASKQEAMLKFMESIQNSDESTERY